MRVKLLAPIVMLLIFISLLPAWSQNNLALNVVSEAAYFKPGDPIFVTMDVSDLLQPINCCQALIGYNSKYLTSPHQIVPGGGPWQEMIYDAFNDSAGELDTAIGIKLDSPVMATTADGTVAVLTFTAGDEGTTHLVFREDGDLGYATLFSSVDAQPVYPTKMDSTLIYIDETAPTAAITSVSQHGTEYINGIRNVVQGDVDITVTASDEISGLSGAPIVTVTHNGAQPEEAAFVNESPSGVFHYQYRVTSKTPNWIATVNAIAEDNCGNTFTAVTQQFKINKNQGAIQVELEALNPASDLERDVTFTFTSLSNNVLETRVVPVIFAPHSAVSTVVLKDISGAVAHISAKTNWNLRRRMNVVMDADGQFSINFTGNDKLRGGDINQDNMVQTSDYSLLKYNWLSKDSLADINGDGQVQTQDYAILKYNWLGKGDLP